MTLKFSKSMSGLFLYQTMFKTLGNPLIAGFAIYKDVRPTPAEISTNWSKYRRTSGSNLLWNGALALSYDFANDEIYSTSIAVTSPPYAAGTASWGVLFTQGGSTTTGVPFSQPSMTAAYTRFIVFDVSDLNGTAPLRLQQLNLSPADGDLTLIDFSLKAKTQ